MKKLKYGSLVSLGIAGIFAACFTACNSEDSASKAEPLQTQALALASTAASPSPSPSKSVTASPTPSVSFLPMYDSTHKLLPSDAGFVSVMSYGAKGDGITDDTAAIQAAMAANIATVHRVVFFPKGTYLVSKPLLWGVPTPTGAYVAAWKSRLTLQGQGQGASIIKLSDYNPEYEDPSNPSDVLHVASENISNESTAALADGAGNDGFDNFIFDLTVDTGKGNPGAIGIDYIGNNFCGIRNVTIQSSDPHSSGVTGLSMERYATGPCIMKNITVSGFNYGVAATSNDYGITFDGLTLHNQLVAGIYDKTDSLSIENLHTMEAVPAIQNLNSAGLITLIDANLDYGNPDVSAIENLGTLYARNVATSGYLSAIQESDLTLTGTSVSEYDSGPVFTQFKGPSSSLGLPILDTPNFQDANPAHWVSVISKGADPTGVADSTEAIQAAIDSGATVVYFPTGDYAISNTIHLRGKVQRVYGYDSSLYAITPKGTTTWQNPSSPTVMIADDSTTAGVTLDHLFLGESYVAYNGITYIQDNSPGYLALLDGVANNYKETGVSTEYVNTSSGTGTLFLEDFGGFPFIFNNQTVYARQLDMEGVGTKATNNGGSLWVLGIKIEGSGTIINTEASGKTEVLGGNLYPDHVQENGAAFVVNDSEASFVYSVSAYSALPAPNPSPSASGMSYSDFQIQVTETQGATTLGLDTTLVPRRGDGAMMPLYSSKR